MASAPPPAVGFFDREVRTMMKPFHNMMSFGMNSIMKPLTKGVKHMGHSLMKNMGHMNSHSHGHTSSSYGAPKPSYRPPMMSYGDPAPTTYKPSYNVDQPSYGAPQPSYGAPNGGYGSPAAPVLTAPYEAPHMATASASAGGYGVPAAPVLASPSSYAAPQADAHGSSMMSSGHGPSSVHDAPVASYQAPMASHDGDSSGYGNPAAPVLSSASSSYESPQPNESGSPGYGSPQAPIISSGSGSSHQELHHADMASMSSDGYGAALAPVLSSPHTSHSAHATSAMSSSSSHGMSETSMHSGKSPLPGYAAPPSATKMSHKAPAQSYKSPHPAGYGMPDAPIISSVESSSHEMPKHSMPSSSYGAPSALVASGDEHRARAAPATPSTKTSGFAVHAATPTSSPVYYKMMESDHHELSVSSVDRHPHHAAAATPLSAPPTSYVASFPAAEDHGVSQSHVLSEQRHSSPVYITNDLEPAIPTFPVVRNFVE